MLQATRYGVSYDADALREAVERRKIHLRELSRKCGVGDQDLKNWLNPYPGRRMHWKSVDRLRKALKLTDAEIRQIWGEGEEHGESDG